MAGIYSTRFVLVANGVGATYQVPAGQTAVVRCLTAYNASAAAQPYFLQLVSPQTYLVVGVLAAGGGATPGLDTANIDCRIVFNGGETFEASGGTGVAMSVSGYLFVH